MTKLGKIFLGILIIVLIFIVLFILSRDVPKENIEEIVIEEDNKIENIDYDKTLLEGNKDDLIYISVFPNLKAHGILSYRGSIKGGWFFEGNILINILDTNKNNLLKSNAVAKTDWMTEGPVEFEGNVDFTNLPKGPAYFEIHNDNPSGLPEHDKSILIPIIIE